MSGALLRSASIIAALTLTSAPAAAAKLPIPVFWGTPEKIAKVADLPHTDAFKLKDGTHVDVGVKYKVFEIFSVPLWDYERVLVGHVGVEDKYVVIPPDKLREMAKAAGIDVPEHPDIPVWDAYGGKAIVAALLMMIGAFAFARRRAAA